MARHAAPEDPDTSPLPARHRANPTTTPFTLGYGSEPTTVPMPRLPLLSADTLPPIRPRRGRHAAPDDQ